MIGKRLFWLATGSVAGAVGSQWARRKARQAAEVYTPAQVGKRLATEAEQRLRVVGAQAEERLRAAAAEARAATVDTEARLRERFNAGDTPGRREP